MKSDRSVTNKDGIVWCSVPVICAPYFVAASDSGGSGDRQVSISDVTKSRCRSRQQWFGGS